MSTVDFVVVVLMILSTVLAVLRGFTREVLTIVAFVGAIAAVYYGLPVVRPLFHKMFQDGTTADIAAGAVLGLVTLVALSVISHQVAKGVNKAGLGIVDRTLGAGFGIARAALVLCIVYIAMQWFYAGHLPEWLTQAKSTPLIARGSDRLVAMLPESVQDEIKPDAEKDKKVKADVDDAVDKANDKIDRATDGEKAPTPPEKPDDAGYDKSDRKGLDKLLQKDDEAK